jgi:hypothetical protein
MQAGCGGGARKGRGLLILIEYGFYRLCVSGAAHHLLG